MRSPPSTSCGKSKSSWLSGAKLDSPRSLHITQTSLGFVASITTFLEWVVKIILFGLGGLGRYLHSRVLRIHVMTEFSGSSSTSIAARGSCSATSSAKLCYGSSDISATVHGSTNPLFVKI